MTTKIENRVGVNFAILLLLLFWLFFFFFCFFSCSNNWLQFIVLLEICCKDTNIHETEENKISDLWLHKAKNVRACHIYQMQQCAIFQIFSAGFSFKRGIHFTNGGFTISNWGLNCFKLVFENSIAFFLTVWLRFQSLNSSLKLQSGFLTRYGYKSVQTIVWKL